MGGISIAGVPVDARALRDRLVWLIEQDPAQVAAVAARPGIERGRRWIAPFAEDGVGASAPWERWIPIVAASAAPGEVGRLGFVLATLQFTDRPEHPTGEGGCDSGKTAEAVRRRYAEHHVAEVLGRRSLSIETIVPVGAGGDSLALSCGAAVVAAAFEGTIDPRTAFSGGWGMHGGRDKFLPPAPETLESKLRCLAAWGIARLVVPEGTVLPADRHGIEIVEVDGDAAALAAALVARGILQLSTPERIAAIITLLDRQSGSGRYLSEGARGLLERWANGPDPLPKALAADLLGRMELHAGRTAEAMARFDAADACDLSPLPESPIREQWRYERSAVRQVAMIDTGHFDDDGTIAQVTMAHGKVNRAIEQLREEAPTRHEWFMRFILQNTRARRWEYLGRLHGNAAHFDRAWADLTAEHSRWAELVEIAKTDLGRNETTIERIENQCIDLLQSRNELAAVDAKHGPVPEAWLQVARGFARSSSPVAGLRSYDLLGWLKLRSVLDGGVDAADLRTAAETLGVLGGGDSADGGGDEGHGTATSLCYPDFISLEWLLRLDRTHSLPTEQLAEALERAIDAATESDGIFRILALRSAAVLQLHAGRRGAIAAVRESGFESLRSLRTTIVGDGDPAGVMRRCPY